MPQQQLVALLLVAPLIAHSGEDSMAKRTKVLHRGRNETVGPLPKKLPVASRLLLKELPSDAELTRRMSSLKRYGHQATAIMGAAYLEHALEVLVRQRFRKLHRDDDIRMFDGAQGGILAGLSNKVRIAYAMKLIHEDPYKALLLVNDIRNVFAHSLHRVTFRNGLVKRDCDQLCQIAVALSSIAGVNPDDKAIDIYAKIVRALYLSIRHAAEGSP
jgi:hypothetical protein